MDYKRIYDSLMSVAIERAWSKGSMPLLERHHIVPKSAGGDNSKSNLVYLTPREHFVAHKLLWKCSPTRANLFAYIAMTRMSKLGTKRCNSRDVERARRIAAQLSSERMIESNPSTGKFGRDSPKHIGLWVTPAGTFESVSQAAIANGIGRSSIQRRCRNPDNVITADRLGIENRGKSWRELGYWFENKAA